MTLGTRRETEKINDYENESQTSIEEPQKQRQCWRLPERRPLFLPTGTLHLRALQLQVMGLTASSKRQARPGRVPGRLP